MWVTGRTKGWGCPPLSTYSIPGLAESRHLAPCVDGTRELQGVAICYVARSVCARGTGGEWVAESLKPPSTVGPACSSTARVPFLNPSVWLSVCCLPSS